MDPFLVLLPAVWVLKMKKNQGKQQFLCTKLLLPVVRKSMQTNFVYIFIGALIYCFNILLIPHYFRRRCSPENEFLWDHFLRMLKTWRRLRRKTLRFWCTQARSVRRVLYFMGKVENKNLKCFKAELRELSHNVSHKGWGGFVWSTKCEPVHTCKCSTCLGRLWPLN